MFQIDKSTDIEDERLMAAAGWGFKGKGASANGYGFPWG